MSRPVRKAGQAVSAQAVQQLAALNGLELSLERAAALAPALAELLAVDDEIVLLDIARLPAVGLPWDAGAEA